MVPSSDKPFAGITRHPSDEIKTIRALLDDVYKDGGDGSTIVRELIQNADDARASRIELVILDQGLEAARNSLLRGPALLVANNGPFSEDDAKALHQAIGGSKEDDPSKIGTFGIGLKSVFHVCEAFAYVGAKASSEVVHVLNPWTGTNPDRPDEDPIHKDWNDLDEDEEQLRAIAEKLLPGLRDGLLLWLPLRQKSHIDRGEEGSSYGLRTHCVVPEEVNAWFAPERTTSAVLLLAQCSHVREIVAARAGGPDAISDRRQISRICRPNANDTWLDRYNNDSDQQHTERFFHGGVDANGQRWRIVGAEAIGSQELRQMKESEDWPKVSLFRGGQHRFVLRKGLAHAAVTVLRPPSPSGQLGVRLRWAAFLPLNDDPNPRTGDDNVEPFGDAPAWEVVLHGYFWPSQDRRTIPGVTDDDTQHVRNRWNKTIRDDLLLPLLPNVLARAVAHEDQQEARELLRSIEQSNIVRGHKQSILSRHWLLPEATAEGVSWIACQCRFLAIPHWTKADDDLRRTLAAAWDDFPDDLVVVDGNAPRLADPPSAWTANYLKCLLCRIPQEVFDSAQRLSWVANLLGDALSGSRDCAALMAKWLGRMIGDRALTAALKQQPEQEALRTAWWDMCKALPEDWLVPVPAEGILAVKALAAERVFGRGLFPALFAPTDALPQSAPDADRLDSALTALGKQLRQADLSASGMHARLRLAEALFAVRRNDRPLDADLASLPLIRSMKLPIAEEVAWSVVETRMWIDCNLAFMGTKTQQDTKQAVQAVNDLALALGVDAWLVSGERLPMEHPPSPQGIALTRPVLQASSFAPPERRVALVQRLAKSLNGNDDIRLAIRALLTGVAANKVGLDVDIYYATDNARQRTLEILLGLLGRPWASVAGELTTTIQRLPIDATAVLSVKECALALDDLVAELSADEPQRLQIDDADALCLLINLHGPSREDEQRWRSLPIHRCANGHRAAVHEQTYRATCDVDVPPALLSRLRLLDPEPDVAHLYGSVPQLTEDDILRLMLSNDDPVQFADDIVARLRIALPRDAELRQLIRRRPWLPLQSGDGLGPDKLLVAPASLLAVLGEFGRAGAFGECRLPEDVDRSFWCNAEPVVREILGSRKRLLQLKQVADALDTETARQVSDGAYVIVPDFNLVSPEFVNDAMGTALVREHRGWALIAAFSKCLGEGTDEANGLLVKVARKLCGDVPAGQQVEMLRTVGDQRPTKDSPGGRTFEKLLAVFAAIDVFRTEVLPHICLPTQDGNWHAAKYIAKSATGVVRRHLVLVDLREPLALEEATPIMAGGTVDQSERLDGASTLDTLRTYFEPWRGRVPHTAIAAFLALLGQGLRQSIERLADEWMDSTTTLDALRHKLQGPEHADNPAAAVSVWVSPRVADGEQIVVANILGDSVEMESAPTETLFAVDPLRRPRSLASALAPLGDFWEIQLRDVQPQQKSRDDLLELLGNTVDRWAGKQLGVDSQLVRDWWHERRGPQAEVRPVRASVLAHLPLTLRQLDVKNHDADALHSALVKAEQAQRNREQIGSKEALEQERKALDELATCVEAPHHQKFLWCRVQKAMRRDGYDESSVLLELAQNADDALAEAAEINGGSLSPDACRLVIDVDQQGTGTIVDITHYGRPINDTGGAAFPAGKDRQWDQDLYYMMLRNLSGKPGEALGRMNIASTTGLFGLGFKSVHLLSSRPSVVSGFISFSIAGGILPKEELLPAEGDPPTVAGRRGTRIRLPLHSDALLERAFKRFNYGRTLLPVFARQVVEVIVRGDRFPGRHSFNGEPVGVPGWSFSAEIDLPSDGRWRILRFKPAEAGQAGLGTLALAVGVRRGKPCAFPSEMPFLWNVVPTGEGWGCGYAVNGPFKLDPGRVHVSLDDETTLRAVEELGCALGKGLIELYDSGAPTKDAGDSFFPELWQVLAMGLSSDDDKRLRFLRGLHGDDRGLSAWMRARSVVPTGLPSPFAPTLPRLTSDVRIEVAGDHFDGGRWFGALAEIARTDADMAASIDNRHVVSKNVAALLRPLLADDHSWSHRELSPRDIVAGLVGAWHYRLTPERLWALRPLANRELIWHGEFIPWRKGMTARSATGEYTPLRQLLLPLGTEVAEFSGDLEEELRRSAFAPADHVLESSYCKASSDVAVFRWLRDAYAIDAATMARWCCEIDEDKQEAALRYLLEGRLSREVLAQILDLPKRPAWLADFDHFNGLFRESDTQWQRNPLLISLFPDRFEPKLTEGVESDQPSSEDCTNAASEFVEKLLCWWSDDKTRAKVIDRHEKHTWPDWLRGKGHLVKGLRDNQRDPWLALLVLGACQSFGRTNDKQHRGFLEMSHQKGWWDVFLNPNDDRAWMGVLRSWQDSAVDQLQYRLWMSLFPFIYHFSRHLEIYRRLLLSAPRRGTGLDPSRLLMPRGDETLSGAGAQFDAPPAPIGIGFHWVLRELVRLGILEATKATGLFPDCYVPALRVLELLQPLGLATSSGQSNAAKARAIHDFLQKHGMQHTANSHFDLTFDIPLRHVAENEGLRRRWRLDLGSYETRRDGWILSKIEERADFEG